MLEMANLVFASIATASYITLRAHTKHVELLACFRSTFPQSFVMVLTNHSTQFIVHPPSYRRPLVISGPSGVGKSTLCQRLLDAHAGTLVTTVSHTTREPRPNEVEGLSYYFVSRTEFEALVAKNTFIEYTEYNGNLYGTSKQTVIDQTAKGSVVLLDIEMEGVKQLKEEQLRENSQIDPRFVFIEPPSFAVLEARLRGRGTEDEGSIQRRLAQARAELDYAKTGIHDKVIVNHDLEKAYQELEDFAFGN